MYKKITIIICSLFSFATLCSCSSGVGEQGISLEEFNQIYVGMRKEKVEEIIGGSGQLISEKENETEKYIEHIHVYKYEGEKSGYAEIQFNLKSYKGLEILTKGVGNYELTEKTQYDLK